MNPNDTVTMTGAELSELLNIAISRDPMTAFLARKLAELNARAAPVAAPMTVIDQPIIDPA